MINNNYNINESEIEQLNEANIFKKGLLLLTGLISWASIKTFKYAMKTGKSIYLKRYLDSVEEQIKKGTKSNHPDGFDKIIAKANDELISDFEKFTELFNNIKEDISSNEDINPINLRLLNNSQEIFKKKYIDSIKSLMDSLIKQYDSAINNAIDKFNADYNKKESIGKKLDGDKIKKVWESYKNKIEEIRDEYIQNFEESENFKKLYGLIFGEMNQLKKELDMHFSGRNSSPLLLREIKVDSGGYYDDKADMADKIVSVKMTVNYQLNTLQNLNNNIKVNAAYFIQILDDKLFDDLKDKLFEMPNTEGGLNNFMKYVKDLKSNNTNKIYCNSMQDKVDFLDNKSSKNIYKFSLTYNYKNIANLIPIINLNRDQKHLDTSDKNSNEINNDGTFYAISILVFGNRVYKAAQEYPVTNKGSLSINVI